METRPNQEFNILVVQQRYLSRHFNLLITWSILTIQSGQSDRTDYMTSGLVFSVQTEKSTIRNFIGGGVAGVVDGEGDRERCLKWSGEGGGSLRNLCKNISK